MVWGMSLEPGLQAQNIDLPVVAPVYVEQLQLPILMSWFWPDRGIIWPRPSQHEVDMLLCWHIVRNHSRNNTVNYVSWNLKSGGVVSNM